MIIIFLSSPVVRVIVAICAIFYTHHHSLGTFGSSSFFTFSLSFLLRLLYHPSQNLCSASHFVIYFIFCHSRLSYPVHVCSLEKLQMEKRNGKMFVSARRLAVNVYVMIVMEVKISIGNWTHTTKQGEFATDSKWWIGSFNSVNALERYI